MRTILWQAITAEENLSQQYRYWAGQTTKPELAALFRQLAEEHIRHAALLRGWLAQIP